MQIYCDDCDVGIEKECCHAEGRHYDIWGEGLSAPDYCPFKPELPFTFRPDAENDDEVCTS